MEDHLTNRDDRITAYVFGEMTPREAQALEKEMAADPSLQGEVQAAKEALEAATGWLGAEAPGVERVDDIAVPALRTGKAGWRRIWPQWVPLSPTFLVQGAAVTVIFLLGFFIGHETASDRLPPEPHQDLSAYAPSASNPEEATAKPTPAVVEDKEGIPADFRPERRVTDENGRIVIETTLSRTGTQAVWVVDGGFSLAN